MKLLKAAKAILLFPLNARNAAVGVQALSERLEFVRRELFFEIKYGRPERREDKPEIMRIVDQGKVDAAIRSGLRLNVGCGHVPLQGYVNVDMRAVPGVDVVAGLDDLPFEAGTVREISSTHVLEHFPQEMLRRRLLPYWYGLLAPGGLFRAVVPDAKAMMSHYAAGTYGFEEFREVFFGAQDYEGDFHYNMFTPESISKLLAEAGFVDVAIPVEGRRNGKCFEFEVTGRRPG